MDAGRRQSLWLLYRSAEPVGRNGYRRGEWKEKGTENRMGRKRGGETSRFKTPEVAASPKTHFSGSSFTTNGLPNVSSGPTKTAMPVSTDSAVHTILPAVIKRPFSDSAKILLPAA